MIQFFPDPETLSQAAAKRVLQTGMAAIVDRDRFELVLAGGKTPRRCYEILAERLRDENDFWKDTHLWWSDERCVAPDDPESNYRLAKESLLDAVRIPPENVHRIPAEAPDPGAVAAEYAQAFPLYPDLLLMGMGVDGHTASLFRGSSAIEESEQRFVATTAPVAPTGRITITTPGIYSARSILVLVTGPAKAAAMQHVFSEGDVRQTPAALLCDATWYVTQDAMG